VLETDTHHAWQKQHFQQSDQIKFTKKNQFPAMKRGADEETTDVKRAKPNDIDEAETPKSKPAPEIKDANETAEKAPKVKLRRPLSMWDVEPLDDVARVVCEYLKSYIGEEGLEVRRHSHLDADVAKIEAKLGIVTEKLRGERAYLEVDSESVLKGDPRFGFESNMTLPQHALYNKILNHQVEASAKPDYRGPPIRYVHRYEVDEFYEDLQTRQKIRVTRDQKTNAILATVQKQRISNLNIYNPDFGLDFRISVNLEIPMAVSASTLQVGAERSRKKDRLSYTYDCFSIDLTQVHNLEKGLPAPNQPPLHELEVEIVNPNKYLGRELQAAMQGDPYAERRYEDIIKAFLNNVRYLARRCDAETNTRPGQRFAAPPSNALKE